jgi:hypothetical protein
VAELAQVLAVGTVFLPYLALTAVALGIAALVVIKRKRATGRGVALIGLSLGAAYLLVIAADLLVARRGVALEINAMRSCQAYAKAQATYHRNAWAKDDKLTYATPFNLLNTQRDSTGKPIMLLHSAIASAMSPSGPRHGYYFADMETIDGKPIDWAKDFALCVMPARYGRTGYQVFIVKTDGVVWCQDLGKSEFVSDFPADPAAAGWHIAE